MPAGAGVLLLQFSTVTAKRPDYYTLLNDRDGGFQPPSLVTTALLIELAFLAEAALAGAGGRVGDQQQGTHDTGDN